MHIMQLNWVFVLKHQHGCCGYPILTAASVVEPTAIHRLHNIILYENLPPLQACWYNSTLLPCCTTFMQQAIPLYTWADPGRELAFAFSHHASKSTRFIQSQIAALLHSLLRSIMLTWNKLASASQLCDDWLYWLALLTRTSKLWTYVLL